MLMSTSSRPSAAAAWSTSAAHSARRDRFGLDARRAAA